MRISSTTLRVWQQCQRRFYLEYVAKAPRLDTPPDFSFGTQAHAVAEDLLKGREPRHGGWAYEVGAAFAELTRKACEISGIEKSFRITDHTFGGTFTGIIDAWGWRDGVPVIVDHKTASAPKTACKTPEQLKSDVQALLYSYAVMLETGADRVICHWHWLPRNRRANAMDGAFITEVEVTWAEAEKIAAWACQAATEIADLAELPQPYYRTHEDPFQLRCSGEDGNGFYTCPYLGGCEQMAFLDDLLSGKEATNKTEPSQTPAKAPQVNPVASDKPVDVDGLIKEAVDILSRHGFDASDACVLGYLLGRHGRR